MDARDSRECANDEEQQADFLGRVSLAKSGHGKWAVPTLSHFAEESENSRTKKTLVSSKVSKNVLGNFEYKLISLRPKFACITLHRMNNFNGQLNHRIRLKCKLCPIMTVEEFLSVLTSIESRRGGLSGIASSMILKFQTCMPR